jgi:hypothetical protein
MKRSLSLIFATLLTACDAGSAGELVLAIDTSSLTGPLADSGTPITDETGLALLERFPLFLVLRVNGSDLDQPIVATWPEEVPEELPETVTLELEIPAGEERRGSLDLVIVEDTGSVFTYVLPEPGNSPPTFDIAPGQEMLMDLAPAELAHGTLEATWNGSPSLDHLSWVDDRAGVVLPPVIVNDDQTTAELSVGRVYWPRVTFEDGTVSDLDHQPVSLSSEGELQQIELEL